MASLDTTELKLKTTPTGGVEAAHSPYYRRLLSAGYKGFLQGSIGGAALYGTFGLVIGGLAAAILGPLGIISAAAAWVIIPAAVGFGVFKGASTFGNIGSVAAINAESADLSEQRRYLLDRYYDLPEGPEGDREAEAIKRELLVRQLDSQGSPPFFHWKTLAIGAAIGSLLVLGGLAASGFFIGPAVTASAIEGFLTSVGFPLASKLSLGLTSTVALASVGGLAGALAGATIGIDRYYVRKWFDHTEGVVHGSTHHETALMERQQQVARLKEAAKQDEKTKYQLQTGEAAVAISPVAAETPVQTKPIEAQPIASLDKAAPSIGSAKIQASEATLQGRVKGLQSILQVAPV